MVLIFALYLPLARDRDLELETIVRPQGFLGVFHIERCLLYLSATAEFSSHWLQRQSRLSFIGCSAAIVFHWLFHFLIGCLLSSVSDDVSSFCNQNSEENYPVDSQPTQ